MTNANLEIRERLSLDELINRLHQAINLKISEEKTSTAVITKKLNSSAKKLNRSAKITAKNSSDHDDVNDVNIEREEVKEKIREEVKAESFVYDEIEVTRMKP